MLSDNELERIKDKEESRLAREREGEEIKFESEVEQRQRKSTNNVILIFLIILGIIFGVSLFILISQMLG